MNVGIDLGTTNSALAYIDPATVDADTPPRIETLPIPQRVGPDRVAPGRVLPSVLYLGEDVGKYGGIFSSTAGLLGSAPDDLSAVVERYTADRGSLQRFYDVALSPLTERAMREAIGTLRPGVYEHAITSDGFEEPITIRARCEVRGDEIAVDYSGSSPASRRGVNVVMNYTEAYTTYGVKVIVSPDVPNNDGAFRPLRITAPEGCILNVRRPAAVAARHVIGHFLPHVVAGALGQAVPDRVMAEGSANIWGVQVSGKDLADTPFTYVFFSSGGTGARPMKDGLSATAFVPGLPDSWEGWEDAAVPPDRLGAYLRDFRHLLDRFGYRGTLYGHFGQGCVHTRTNFDLKTDDGLTKGTFAAPDLPGDGKILVKGRGPWLGAPDASLETPILLLVSRTDDPAKCWQAAISSPTANADGKFVGNSY